MPQRHLNVEEGAAWGRRGSGTVRVCWRRWGWGLRGSQRSCPSVSSPRRVPSPPHGASENPGRVKCDDERRRSLVPAPALPLPGRVAGAPRLSFSIHTQPWEESARISGFEWGARRSVALAGESGSGDRPRRQQAGLLPVLRDHEAHLPAAGSMTDWWGEAPQSLRQVALEPALCFQRRAVLWVSAWWGVRPAHPAMPCSSGTSPFPGAGPRLLSAPVMAWEQASWVRQAGLPSTSALSPGAGQRGPLGPPRPLQGPLPVSLCRISPTCSA